MKEIKSVRAVYYHDGAEETIARLLLSPNGIVVVPEAGLKRLSPFVVIGTNEYIRPKFVDANQEKSFHGLLGVFADSVPDTFGLEAVKQYLKEKEILFSPLATLAYVGKWGRGAIGYIPEIENLHDDRDIKIPDLYNEALRVGNGILVELERGRVMDYKMGTVGGTRPKAFVTITENGVVRTQRGWGVPLEGELPYLLKFDCTGEFNGKIDEETRVEAAYMDMARKVGIAVVDYRILQSEDRYHLALRRFDRLAEYPHSPIHFHSYWGVMQSKSEYQNYEYLLRASLRLTKDVSGRIEQDIFRRMVFNIVMVNQDDHHKQHGYLYDGRTWSLSPAYDLTHQEINIGHQMTVQESRFPTVKQIKDFAEKMGVKDWRNILDEVIQMAKGVGDFLQNHNLSEKRTQQIHHRIQQQIAQLSRN